MGKKKLNVGSVFENPEKRLVPVDLGLKFFVFNFLICCYYFYSMQALSAAMP
jgi:hypothetical protein